MSSIESAVLNIERNHERAEEAEQRYINKVHDIAMVKDEQIRLKLRQNNAGMLSKVAMKLCDSALNVESILNVLIMDTVEGKPSFQQLLDRAIYKVATEMAEEELDNQHGYY